MSKKRTAAKYGIAGALTALYGLSVYTVHKNPDQAPRINWKRQVGVAAGIAAATWLVAYL